DLPAAGRGEVPADLLDGELAVLAAGRGQVAGDEIARGVCPVVADVEETRVTLLAAFLPHVAAGVIPLVRFVAGHGGAGITCEAATDAGWWWLRSDADAQKTQHTRRQDKTYDRRLLI